MFVPSVQSAVEKAISDILEKKNFYQAQQDEECAREDEIRKKIEEEEKIREKERMELEKLQEQLPDSEKITDLKEGRPYVNYCI